MASHAFGVGDQDFAKIFAKCGAQCRHLSASTPSIPGARECLMANVEETRAEFLPAQPMNGLHITEKALKLLRRMLDTNGGSVVGGVCVTHGQYLEVGPRGSVGAL